MSKRLEAALAAAKKAEEKAARMQAHEIARTRMNDALKLLRAEDYATAADVARIALEMAEMLAEMDAGATPGKVSE